MLYISFGLKSFAIFLSGCTSSSFPDELGVLEATDGSESLTSGRSRGASETSSPGSGRTEQQRHVPRVPGTEDIQVEGEARQISGRWVKIQQN